MFGTKDAARLCKVAVINEAKRRMLWLNPSVMQHSVCVRARPSYVSLIHQDKRYLWK
jgi:hypothetical protein